MRLIIGLVIAGFLFMAVRNYQLKSEVDSEKKRRESEELRLSRIENQLEGNRSRVQGQIREEQKIIEEIQRQIQSKQNEKQNISGQLSQLKNLETGARDVGAADWDYKNQKEKVDSLDRALRQVSADRAALEGQGKMSREQLAQIKKQKDFEFDQYIQAQKEKIKLMHDQYNDLKVQKLDITAQEDARRLLPQIKDEELGLDRIKLQKQQFDLGASAPTGSVELSRNLLKIRANEKDLREQVQRAREELKIIQARLNDAKKESASQKSDVSSVQKQVQTLDSAISDLNAKLLEHKGRLKQLESSLN